MFSCDTHLHASIYLHGRRRVRGPADAWNTMMRSYTMPRVFNLMNDPLEQDNVLFPHTWVLKAGLPQLDEHAASLKEHPPIPTGSLDPYEPPKK